MSKGSTQIQETPAQRAMAEHAQLVMADYKQRWMPVQRNLISTIQQMGATGSQARAEAAGKASTDTAIQFDRAQGALEKSLTSHGAAPGSGRADMAITGLGNDAAKSSGMGQMVSDQQITDAYTRGLTSLAAIGRGESAQVGQGMEAQAASSGMQAQADAQAALEGRMATGGAVGTAIGLAGQQLLKPKAPSGTGYTLTSNDAQSLYGNVGYTGGP